MRRQMLLAVSLISSLVLSTAGCVAPLAPDSTTDGTPTSVVSGAGAAAGGAGGTPAPGGGSGSTPAPAGGTGATPAPTPLSDTPVPGVYYVSPAGNDTTGNASPARPWRTIAYALSRADYTGVVPAVHVAAGTYDENIAIDRSVTIAGEGANAVTVRSSDPAYTGFLVRTGDAVAAGGVPITVRISGVRFDGQSGKNSGLHTTRTDLTLDGINVYAPGALSVVIDAGTPHFAITNSTFGYVGLLYSDVGIDVGANSTGTITNCTLGDHIDHAISISTGCTVTVDNCQISGSPIYWADGIRVQGASNVTIANTTLIRPPGSAPASAGPLHNPPYAGIEVAASSDGGATVSVSNCTVRGFDVGVGINLMYNALRVQNCALGGNVSADVQTLWSGHSAGQYPVVDFGGGPLGSVGGNDFGSGAEWAVQLSGPYDISMYGAQWGVSAALVESRIFDELDDASVGRVLH